MSVVDGTMTGMTLRHEGLVVRLDVNHVQAGYLSGAA